MVETQRSSLVWDFQKPDFRSQNDSKINKRFENLFLRAANSGPKSNDYKVFVKEFHLYEILKTEFRIQKWYKNVLKISS